MRTCVSCEAVLAQVGGERQFEVSGLSKAHRDTGWKAGADHVGSAQSRAMDGLNTRIIRNPLECFKSLRIQESQVRFSVSHYILEIICINFYVQD